MTIDTQEALRLLDKLYDHATDCCEFMRDHSPINVIRDAYRELRALLCEDGEPRDWHDEKDGFTAKGRKPFTYQHQPRIIGAWRLGEACSKARPGGYYIDTGLSLLQQLQIRGYGVVPVAALRDAEKEKGNG